MTKKAMKARYLKASHRCPYCQSVLIEAECDREYCGDEMIQGVCCLTCNRRWRDVFRLSDVILEPKP